VCVAYETASGRTAELPLTELDHAKPVYESFPGWTESLEDARSLDALPSSARALVARIEELTETPAYLVSVGARRDRTITLRDVFAATRS
jgi:adenylosuccinate synthase